MKYIIIISLSLLLFASCKHTKEQNTGKLKVVTTTTMLTDLAENIGGDQIELQGLMGSGVDPHLYKASEGDVSKLVNADVIFYNDSMEVIMQKFKGTGAWNLPVIKDNKYLGFISKSKLLTAYRTKLMEISLTT